MTSVLYTLSMNKSKQAESISEINRRRTANKNSTFVMALLFIALIAGSSATNGPDEALETGDILWGALTVIAFTSLIWALYVSFKQSDERQQLIQLKASSSTFAAVILSIVTGQILYALNIVSLSISIQFVVIGGILLWMSLLKVFERRSN